MSLAMIELRCSRELAIKLGAIDPINPAHHRDLRLTRRYMLLRDPPTMLPMFWLIQGEPPEVVSREGAQ